jgi:hypothetical protein
MLRAKSRSGTVVATFVAVGCGYRDIEPPRAPSREMPNVEARSTPPAEGRTRVILDANGERAVVTEVRDWSSGFASAGTTTAHGYSEEVRPVCITPCVVDFEPGLHVLRFRSERDDRKGTLNLQVGERTKIVRHAMGRTEGTSVAHFGGGLLLTLGTIALTVGGIALAAGAASDSSLGDDTLETGAKISAAGAGAVLVSIPLLLVTRPTRQPGATTEFEP